MKNNISPDCLFIHVPYLNLYRPKEYSSFVNTMAMGIFSMANELYKIGFTPQILHLGIEKALNTDFDIAEYIKENNIKFIAISLHWHHQTYDSLNVAKHIKEINPDTFIVLGGYTSSAFAKDILEEHNYIDAVIKGEGEKPLTEIAKRFKDGNFDLSGIPNTCWRDNNIVKINDILWFADEQDLNSYDFNGLKFLKNKEMYLNLNIGFHHNLENNEYELKKEKQIVGCLGRGCPGNCTWCGGGFKAIKRITGRNKVTLRNPEIVAKEFIKFKKEYDIDTFYICYDPYPQKQEYLVNLFEMLGKEMPNQINIHFECFGLPSEDFANAFKKNLGEKSKIIISPEFGDDEYRKEHKNGFSYSNEQLLNCLSLINKLNINCLLYFTELPNEHPLQKKKTHWLIDKIRQEYPDLDIDLIPISDFEPFSPWVLEPEKYGIKPTLYTLKDYVKNSKGFRDFI